MLAIKLRIVHTLSIKIEGAPPILKKNVQFDIHQINEFEYESIVYADAVLNEDYFGDGVCHWNPEGFGFHYQQRVNRKKLDSILAIYWKSY